MCLQAGTTCSMLDVCFFRQGLAIYPTGSLGTCCGARDGLELMVILLSHSSKCWDNRPDPPQPVPL